MRLIDADKIRYSDMSDGQVPGGLWYTFKETIDKTPTVKAIPIDWLRELQVRYLKADCNMSVCVVNEILNLWEKENETNRQR